MTSPTADQQDQRFQIGEVAERTGVTQRTLRFYEEKGLLNPPERMDGGFRLYSESDIQRISYIRQLQQLLGFTLAEIKEMVQAEELRQQMAATYRPDLAAATRVERMGLVLGALSRQLELVDHKVDALQTMQSDLRAKIERMTTRRAELEQVVATEEKTAKKSKK